MKTTTNNERFMTPKLSSLTTQDKIKLAAELDGAEIKYCETLGGLCAYSPCADKWYPSVDKIQYSTSYDTIIPLIQKQDKVISDKISGYLINYCCPVGFGDFKITPSQLLDALLVATGKAEL